MTGTPPTADVAVTPDENSDYVRLWLTPKDGKPVLNRISKGAAEVLVAEIAGCLALKIGEPDAIPMILTCPSCGVRHIDKGEFATKLHRDHACQSCGLVWRPAKVPTVGVRFLPGYSNAEPA